MNAVSQPMIDQVEEGLAKLWFQMEEAGDARFQREIEEVTRLFPTPEDSPFGRRVVERAHDLFQRVLAECAPEMQRRMGSRPIACPHCQGTAAA